MNLDVYQTFHALAPRMQWNCDIVVVLLHKVSLECRSVFESDTSIELQLEVYW